MLWEGGVKEANADANVEVKTGPSGNGPAGVAFLNLLAPLTPGVQLQSLTFFRIP